MKYLLLLPLLLLSSGCATSIMERKVVQQFADAIAEDNEVALRRIASSDFEEKALRSDDALRDLESISLPQGDLEIVESEELDDDHRTVIASDEDGKKYKFELYRDPEKKRWVVDDVLVRQNKKWMRSTAKVTQSTTQVMDLVHTVREFLEVWGRGSRADITRMSSPRLAASLAPVPDPWLKSITGSVSERFDKGMARRPEAQMNDDDAVVKMPVKGGYLLVSTVHHGDQWLVDDIEIHRRSDEGHPGSVRRQADAVGSLSQFLTAYENQDNATLERFATNEFYSGTLKFADLKLVALPSTKTVPREFAIQSFAGQVTVIVPTEREVVRFDMNEVSAAPIEDKTAPSSRRFQVGNVILYDRSRDNQKTLASVFTAPATATLLVKSLAERNFPMLRQLSSEELNRVSWNRASPEVLNHLSIPLSRLQDLTIKDSNVEGRRVELTFAAPDGTLVHSRMIDENGSLKVEDIRYTNVEGQTESLATQLALQIPIIEFAQAWTSGDLERLKAASSTEFKRLVLTNYANVPTEPANLAEHLDGPVLSTRVTQERATVKIGLTETSAAEVTLSTRDGLWAVDDVRLPESSSGQTVEIKRFLRNAIVSSTLQPSPGSRPPREIKTASRPMRSPRRDAAVVGAAASSNDHGLSGAVVNPVWEVVHPEKEDVGLHPAGESHALEAPPAMPSTPPSPPAIPETSSREPIEVDGMLHFGPCAKEISQQSASGESLSRAQPPATESAAIESATPKAGQKKAGIDPADHPIAID